MRFFPFLVALLISTSSFADDDKPRPLDEADEEITTGSAPYAGKIKPETTGSTGVFSERDQTTLKRLLSAVRAKQSVTISQFSFDEEAAKSLGEMLIYRNLDADPARVIAFLQEHPSFPGQSAVRRRLEPRLAINSPYFVRFQAITAKGKALKALTLKDGGLARDVFTTADLTSDMESELLRAFPNLNARDTLRARMDRLLELGEYGSALKIANRLGEGEATLVKLRSAFDDNKKPPISYFNAVPSKFHQDPHYLLAKAQLSRRADDAVTAAPSLLASRGRDKDHWIERRMVARKLLDDDNPALAYKVASSHKGSGGDQLDADFYAGFIALRYLKDAKSALRHFDNAARNASTPASKSQGAYWLGRTYEALGNKAYATQSYQFAATHGTFYYGQLSAAKLGQTHINLKQAAASNQVRSDFNRLAGSRAIQTLYGMGEREQARSLVVDMAYSLQHGDQLTLLGEISRKAGDAKGELLIGKLASQRGFAADITAFPTTGIPQFRAVSGSAEKELVYAIARQESTFDPKAVSHAGAMGLMQMLPATASKTASRAGLGFQKERLTSDPAFNATLGAAHLGELMSDYGSYIMTCIAYNAGPKRVGEWTEKYGDPRKGEIDPIDFVERIPFSETRHYVQKVLENLQVYKTRFGGKASIEADLKRARN